MEAKIFPLKLNMTLLKNLNDDEVNDMVGFVEGLGRDDGEVILQIIELVDTNPAFYNEYHCDLEPIEDDLRKRAVTSYRRGTHNRPRYILHNGVTVEVVRPMHNSSFCMKNNRMRITHDGKFKPCLLRDDNHLDFLTKMRAGASDDEIAQLYRQAVLLREPFFRSHEIDMPVLTPSRTCLGACSD
jgi:cyclic pyranopterin phosphate synthase